MGAALRRAAFAGSWYPRGAAAIALEVEGYLKAACPGALSGRLVGLVSPHAGLHYSGPVAAYGYSLLRGREASSVVLVGPSHRAAFEGVAARTSAAWSASVMGRPCITAAGFRFACSRNATATRPRCSGVVP